MIVLLADWGNWMFKLAYGDVICMGVWVDENGVAQRGYYKLD